MLHHSSARSIGADVTLARAGALYHDIGKSVNPLCFIENQTTALGKDYHEHLSYEQSSHDIISHVSDGVELAKKGGFKVPESIVYVIGTDTLNVPCYPCIVKPLKSIHGGKRFSVCGDRCELEEVLNEYEANNVVQIQEYIRKDEEIVVDGVSVNGDVIIPGYVLKHRDYLGGTTFSTTYPIGKLSEDICTKIRAMIAEIGYEGLFGVELIRSKEKYYY